MGDECRPLELDARSRCAPGVQVLRGQSSRLLAVERTAGPHVQVDGSPVWSPGRLLEFPGVDGESRMDDSLTMSACPHGATLESAAEVAGADFVHMDTRHAHPPVKFQNVDELAAQFAAIGDVDVDVDGQSESPEEREAWEAELDANNTGVERALDVELCAPGYQSSLAKVAAAARRAVVGGQRILHSVGAERTPDVADGHVPRVDVLQSTGPSPVATVAQHARRHIAPAGCITERGWDLNESGGSKDVQVWPHPEHMQRIQPHCPDRELGDLGRAGVDQLPTPGQRDSFSRSRGFDSPWQRDRPSRSRGRDLERKSMELEKTLERRIQHQSSEAKLAEEKAGDVKDSIEASQQERAKREQDLREEIAEVRQATRRTEAQAKQRAKAVRETRDRSEKELSELREITKQFAQVRVEAQKAEKQAAAGVKKQIVQFIDERLQALREADSIRDKLRGGEKELAAAAEKLQDARNQSSQLRAEGAMLEGRIEQLAGLTAEGPSTSSGQAHVRGSEESAIPTATHSAVTRTVRVLEASLSDELSTASEGRREFEAEEHALLRRLSEVESEAAQLREVFRSGGAIPNIDDDARLLHEQRDAARLELNALRDQLSQAAAAAAARAVVDEASDIAERRDEATSEELSHMYENLRTVCVSGRRDLEELSAAIERRHAQLPLVNRLDVAAPDEVHCPSHGASLDSEQVSMCSNPQHETEVADSVLEEHQDEIKELRVRHLRCLCEAEMNLCDLEMSQVEECESNQLEEFKCDLFRQEVLRLSTAATGEILNSTCESLSKSSALGKAVVVLADSNADLAALRCARSVLADRFNMLNAASPPSLQELVNLSEQLQSEFRVVSAQRSGETSAQDKEEDAMGAARRVKSLGRAAVEVVECLEEEHAAFKAECNELRSAVRSTRQIARSKSEDEEPHGVEREGYSTGTAETPRYDFVNQRIQTSNEEHEVSHVSALVNHLESMVSAAIKGMDRAQSLVERVSEQQAKTSERLEAFGFADRGLEQTYHQLSSRAAAAERACRSEEEALRQMGAQWDSVRSICIAIDAEPRSETAEYSTARQKLEDAVRVCVAARAAFEKEVVQLTQAEFGFALMHERLESERQTMIARQTTLSGSVDDTCRTPEAGPAVLSASASEAKLVGILKTELQQHGLLPEEQPRRVERANSPDHLADDAGGATASCTSIRDPSVCGVGLLEHLRGGSQAATEQDVQEVDNARIEINESSCLQHCRVLDEVAADLASLRDQLSSVESIGAQKAQAPAAGFDIAAQRRLLAARAEFAMSRSFQQATSLEDSLYQRRVLRAHGVVAADVISGLPSPQRAAVCHDLEEVAKLQQHVRCLGSEIKKLEETGASSGSELASADSAVIDFQPGLDLQERAVLLDIQAETEAAVCAEEVEWEERESKLRSQWRAAEALAEEAHVDPQDLAQRVMKLRADVDAALQGLATARGTLAKEKAAASLPSSSDAAPDEGASFIPQAQQGSVNADVLHAMECARQTLLHQVASKGGEITPHISDFSQQFQLAQEILERQHEQAMQDVSSRARQRRRELDVCADEQRAKIIDLEGQLRHRRFCWLEDRQKLERRVTCGELEHRALETNLLREISRLEESSAAEVGDSHTSFDQPSLQTLAMSASLRETYGVLCQQQKQLEEASRERDSLQTHLLAVLERISRQHVSFATELQGSTVPAA